MKNKSSPFDYIKSINKKEYDEDISGFVPFITHMYYSAGDRTFTYISNAINKIGVHKLPNRAIYDYYFYSIPKNNKFLQYPKKVKDPKHIKYLQEWFGCDERSAKTALDIIDKNELKEIVEFFENRGFIK